MISEDAMFALANAATTDYQHDQVTMIRPCTLLTLLAEVAQMRASLRALHDLVDQTDPNDPIGVALTKVGLERRP